MHGEMTLDGRRIMMGQGSEEWRMFSPHGAEAATQGIFIYRADVDSRGLRTRLCMIGSSAFIEKFGADAVRTLVVPD